MRGWKLLAPFGITNPVRLRRPVFLFLTKLQPHNTSDEDSIDWMPAPAGMADGALLLTPHTLPFTGSLERVMGIEPTLSAWEAEVLPLNYTRL